MSKRQGRRTKAEGRKRPRSARGAGGKSGGAGPPTVERSQGRKPKAEGRSLLLTHVDARGRVRMVDVGGKPVTAREAVARGSVEMSAAARRAIAAGAVRKGDPLQAARVAGIMAAKRTSELIPLCHPLPITHAGVDLTPTRRGYAIEARVRTEARTGVEMEALTAVAVAALTLYDMLKAVDRGMTIGGIELVEKRGGRSGHYTRK